MLDLILVDQRPDYFKHFIMEHPGWLRDQSVLRLAMLDSPYHIALPQLITTRNASVFHAWAYFYDREDRDILLRSMREGGVDQFLYSFSVLDCEYHLKVLEQEMQRFDYDDVHNGSMKTNERLFNVHRVLYRLKRCIDENLVHETKFHRVLNAKADQDSRAERRDFGRLATKLAEHEGTLKWIMSQLMATLNVRSHQAGVEHMEATSNQAKSMNVLSWVACFYIPLTFATSIFGMNVKEINGSPLSFGIFMIVLSVLLVSTFALVLCYRRLTKNTKHGRGLISSLVTPSSTLSESTEPPETEETYTHDGHHITTTTPEGEKNKARSEILNIFHRRRTALSADSSV